jgi:hypothetical protein
VTPRAAASTLHLRIQPYIDPLPDEGVWARSALQDFEIAPPAGAKPQLAAPAAAAPVATNFKYDYVLQLFKAFLFFEVQRGGTQAPDSAGRSWRQDDASKFDSGVVNGQNKSLDGGWWEAGSARRRGTWLLCCCVLCLQLLNRPHMLGLVDSVAGQAGSRGDPATAAGLARSAPRGSRAADTEHPAGLFAQHGRGQARPHNPAHALLVARFTDHSVLCAAQNLVTDTLASRMPWHMPLSAQQCRVCRPLEGHPSHRLHGVAPRVDLQLPPRAAPVAHLLRHRHHRFWALLWRENRRRPVCGQECL